MQPPEGHRLPLASASAWLPPAVALAPGLFGTAPAQGLGGSKLPDGVLLQPRWYRHWERARRFVQYSQGHAGLTIHPSPPWGQRTPSPILLPITSSMPVHPSSSAGLPLVLGITCGHRLRGRAWHRVLTEGTSLPAPSPSHPLQTFIVMATAPGGESF